MNSSNGSGLNGLSLHMSGDLGPSTGDRLTDTLSSGGRIDLQTTPGLSKALLKGAAHNVRELSKALRELCQKQDAVGRQETVLELQRQITELKGMFSSGKMEVLTTFVSCLHRLAGSLKDNPKPPNPSVLRTITNAFDFLRQLVDSGCDCREVEKNPLRLMVVDDDAVCRRAMTLALSSGDLKLAVYENGVKALDALRDQGFDVIFLDIMMPGLNGLVLSRTIRELPANKETPVVFVTCLSDFKTRSESILSGGCDLMAKPILPSEVLVKAYTLALRKRLSDGELATAPGEDSGVAAPPKVVAPACIGTLHVDQEGFIETFDQDCSRLLGFTPEEIRGQHVFLLFPREIQKDDTLCKVLSDVQAKAAAIVLTGRRKNGSMTLLEATVSGSSSGTSSRMLRLRETDASSSALPTSLDQDAVQTPGCKSPLPQPAMQAQPQPVPAAAPLPQPLRMADPQSPDPQNLASRVSVLEEKLRMATDALANSQEALRREQTRRSQLETQTSVSKTSSANSLATMQAALAAAQQSFESERQKREELERKVESLIAASTSSKNTLEQAAAPQAVLATALKEDSCLGRRPAADLAEPPKEAPIKRKFSDGLRRMWSR